MSGDDTHSDALRGVVGDLLGSVFIIWAAYMFGAVMWLLTQVVE